MTAPTTVTEARLPVPPHRKLGLSLEILRSYVLVRWLMWRHDLPSVLARLREPLPGRRDSVDDPDVAYVVGARLGRAVVRTLAVVPTDSRCLNRSLVLTSLLARRGIDCRLVIGVAAGADFRAHAWVERDGKEMLGRGDEDYTRLTDL